MQANARLLGQLFIATAALALGPPRANAGPLPRSVELKRKLDRILAKAGGKAMTPETRAVVNMLAVAIEKRSIPLEAYTWLDGFLDLAPNNRIWGRQDEHAFRFGHHLPRGYTDTRSFYKDGCIVGECYLGQQPLLFSGLNPFNKEKRLYVAATRKAYLGRGSEYQFSLQSERYKMPLDKEVVERLPSQDKLDLIYRISDLANLYDYSDRFAAEEAASLREVSKKRWPWRLGRRASTSP